MNIGPQSNRQLCVELLEERMVLAGDFFAGDSLPSPYPTDVAPINTPSAFIPQSQHARQLTKVNYFEADPRFQGIDGNGYAVVILDTGIELNHPFFGPDGDSNGIADRIVFQYDFAGDDPDASDPCFDESRCGHGTHVTSIIASQDSVHRGVAPAVEIIHLKVFDDNGNGDFAYIEQALNWTIDNIATYNIVAVNMSISDGGNYSSSQPLYDIDDELQTLANHGVIVVSGSGNFFYGHNSAQGVGYPAADPNSLSVGAVYDADVGAASYQDLSQAFSTGEDRITPFTQRHESLLDILAPGAPTTAAGIGELLTIDGTSQAAPHVTGIAVLAQQLAEQEIGRRLSTEEFVHLLKQSGTTVVDGDDEDDNVLNTGLSFPRADAMELAEMILPELEFWAGDIQHRGAVYFLPNTNDAILWGDGKLWASGRLDEAGIYQIEVRALSQEAAGSSPMMQFNVDNWSVVPDPVEVTNNAWQYRNYIFSDVYLSSGIHDFEVAVINGNQGRALYVSDIFVRKLGPPPDVYCEVDAVDMQGRGGGHYVSESKSAILWGNGQLFLDCEIDRPGIYDVEVRAFGQPAGGDLPSMQLSVDNWSPGEGPVPVENNSWRFESYNFTNIELLEPGTHRFQIAARNSVEGRTLHVAKLILKRTGELQQDLIVLKASQMDATGNVYIPSENNFAVIWNDGTLTHPVHLEEQIPYDIEVYALAEETHGTKPAIQVSIGNGILNDQPISIHNNYWLYRTYHVARVKVAPSVTIDLGLSVVDGIQGRSVYVDKIVLRPPRQPVSAAQATQLSTDYLAMEQSRATSPVGDDTTHHSSRSNANEARSPALQNRVPLHASAVGSDREGELDVLFASEFAKAITWDENAGGQGKSGPQRDIITQPLAFGSPNLFTSDLNGDGPIDLLFSSFYKIAWYEDRNMPGDANGDGRFDACDLLQVLQAGKYDDEIPGNTTLAEGDFNGDGDFNRIDLVYALQFGVYEGAPKQC